MTAESKVYEENELASLAEDFKKLRNPPEGEKRILDKLAPYEKNLERYLAPWKERSRENGDCYPSQGLLHTPYDYLDCNGEHSMLSDEQIKETLRAQTFFLEMSNHPLRIHHLLQVNDSEFKAPKPVECNLFFAARQQNLALSIRDIAATVHWESNDRISRSDRYAQGPFVKLGKQARTIFVGSESPDVWNSAVAVAVMAASHCLAAIPRNGVLQDIDRQADFAVEVFQWLDYYEDLILKGRTDRQIVSAMWRNNVMGTVEASPDKALRRASKMAEVGVRAFRPYSPEPGNGPITTTESLKNEFEKEIEVFTGQIVDTRQAKKCEEAGADGIVVGIGGGGRCTTGPRSGLPIDWPELVHESRGKINIPIIVQGGASDHVAETLQLGATGIGVSRSVAGGTIESPGGGLFCVGEDGRLYHPYGGEASARNKHNEGKMLPFGVPSFVEGETTKAYINYFEPAVLPTLTINLHSLNENVILDLVFKSAKTIDEVQAINPSPLRRITASGEDQRKTH